MMRVVTQMNNEVLKALRKIQVLLHEIKEIPNTVFI
jgi:hypothetical protein